MKSIGYAVVGCGVIAPWHAGSLKDHVTGAHLVACCDEVPARARAFAEKYGIPKVYTRYAELLAQRLDYRNSFLDRGLRVDIVDPPADLLGHFDFLIAADVFQHVPAPVQRAFDGARRLLRPGGLLLLTVPYDPGAPTVEHFDGLHELEVRGEAGQRRLHARAADGSAVVREDLVFHGGEGFTLEMRRFGLRDLLAHCRQAGFGPVAVQGEEVPERGIRWQPWSQPLIARVPDDR